MAEPTAGESTENGTYLHAVLSATSKQIYSLYSAVNNTGTLTVASLPRTLEELTINDEDLPVARNDINSTVVRLYREAAANCFKRNSRSSAEQVEVTFCWKHSPSCNIAVPVTYRGPINQVVQLYRRGIITDDDLENAGITTHTKICLQDQIAP